MFSVRARLAVMMFLQYFVWGAWAVEMGGYMGSVLKFKGWQIGAIYETTAIAAMVSPLFMGYVADRLMSIQKLLALLHLAGAGVLALAAMPDALVKALPIFGSGVDAEFWALRVTMIVYALLYMPTLALTNSISFENMTEPEKEFPLIRVFGTFGWIAAGLVVGFIFKAKPGSTFYELITSVIPKDSSFFMASNFIWLAAASSLVLGLFCFLLPHTPVKSATEDQPTTDRQSIFNLLQDRSFLVFTITSFLICIPLAFYYNLANDFLAQVDAPYPTALQTIGQISEVGFMALMPMFIARLGVRRLLSLGMLAWVVRYVCFGSLSFPLILLGLVLHGVCYDFYFVGSQIYVDNKVDIAQRSRAQSFLAFVTLGLGMFIGARAAGITRDWYPPLIELTVVHADGTPVLENGKPLKSRLPDWDPTGETGLAKALGIKVDGEVSTTALRYLKTRERTPEEIRSGKVPPKVVITDEQAGTGYLTEEMATEIGRSAHGIEDGKFDRTEWRAYQRNQWQMIWLWPAAFAGVTLLLFLAGFRDDVKVK
jgi:nucleoside transporter